MLRRGRGCPGAAAIAAVLFLPAMTTGCGSAEEVVGVSGHPGSGQDGAFVEAAGSPVPGGKWPKAVAVGDFNGDGHTDLAVADGGDPTVTVLLGDGTGGFRPAATSPVHIPTTARGTASHNLDMPSAVAVGDLNGDGHLDLAVTVTDTRPDNVTILLGDGTGNFVPAPSGSVPVEADPNALPQPDSVVVADLNHDGRPDLATANAYGNDVTVLLGKGNGDFTRPAGSPVKVRTQPNHQAAVSAVAVVTSTATGNATWSPRTPTRTTSVSCSATAPADSPRLPTARWRSGTGRAR